MLNSVVEMPMRLEDNKINPAFAEARHFILQPSFSVKRFYAISFDILAAMLTVWMAFSLRFELWHSPVGNQWLIYLLAPVLMIPVFIYAGLYRVVYRHSGFSV